MPALAALRVGRAGILSGGAEPCGWRGRLPWRLCRSQRQAASTSFSASMLTRVSARSAGGAYFDLPPGRAACARTQSLSFCPSLFRAVFPFCRIVAFELALFLHFLAIYECGFLLQWILRCHWPRWSLQQPHLKHPHRTTPAKKEPRLCPPPPRHPPSPASAVS